MECCHIFRFCCGQNCKRLTYRMCSFRSAQFCWWDKTVESNWAQMFLFCFFWHMRTSRYVREIWQKLSKTKYIMPIRSCLDLFGIYGDSQQPWMETNHINDFNIITIIFAYFFIFRNLSLVPHTLQASATITKLRAVKK